MSTVTVLCFAILAVTGFAIDVSLKADGPVSLGQNVTIVAAVKGKLDKEQFEFVFWDDAVPQHVFKTWSEADEVRWTVQYPSDAYEAGQYRADVALSKHIFYVPYKIAEAHTYFTVSD